MAKSTIGGLSTGVSVVQHQRTVNAVDFMLTVEKTHIRANFKWSAAAAHDSWVWLHRDFQAPQNFPLWKNGSSCIEGKRVLCVCACKRLHNCCCFGPFAAKSTQLCITMYDNVWWHALMSLMISYQGCTINWFREWPAEALYSVAKQQLTMNQAWPWSEPARHWRVHGRVDVDDVARFCSCDKLRQVATPEWTQCS